MDKLRFVALSGTTSVTENMYLYEYRDEILVVDCGVGFPEEATFGIDLVIPDFTYLVENKEKIKGILISHGHEDHLGALPFLFNELQAPIYSTQLVAAFIEDKFLDYGKKIKVNIFNPEKEGFNIGSFRIDSFRVAHSVPDGVGFCITTPVGKIFHVPDYKFDWTPIDQKPFDITKAAVLASDGVLALASDALGSTSVGYTKSEREIEQNIDFVIEKAQKRVYFTTLSSNISRMYLAIRASELVGRKVAFVGRSTEKKAEIARKLGHLKWIPGTVITPREAQKLPSDKVTYIISGSYGQTGSALHRVAMGEHPFLQIETDDYVVFSADPAPPGTEQAVNFVVDNLMEKGAVVHYYDTQDDLHVSGHGSQKDIEMLFALIKPKYLIPVGGTIRHMRAYRELAEMMGWKKEQVFELREGESVEFAKDGDPKKGERIAVKNVLVDGLGVGDVGNVVLRDRQTLAKEGVVIVILQTDHQNGKLTAKPDIVSRGFVFAKEQQEFLDRASAELSRKISERIKVANPIGVKEVAVDFLERFFFEETGRRPMVLPVVVEV
ncbi:MAG: ribonuclease J [Microgenomates group bacterium Gr01-1014_5]|nr:MAG: ribonuclease J [Microgenomates group bacterium Gr01-1014_5]